MPATASDHVVFRALTFSLTPGVSGSAETDGSAKTRKQPSPQPAPSSTPPQSCSSHADWPACHDFGPDSQAQS